MDKVRIGIVGVGWAAQVIHLPILMKHPEAVVVAVCDKDKARARLVGEKYGIARQYTNLDQMLWDNSLDAILVCTSTDAHRDIAVAALRAGKDVFVEKPIARSYQEAVDMASVAKESRRKLMVGMNHRFRPDTMILKSFIEGKELGKVFYTRVGWLRKHNLDRAWLTQKEKSGGGAFIDLGIVMLDLALWMMGYPEVVRLVANNYQHRTKQVEDTAVVHLTLKSGAVVNIEVSWSMCLADDVYYCYVHGNEGSASLSPLTINKELHGNLVNLAPSKLDSPQQLFKRSYENEIKHFLGAVKDLHPVVSTGEEAVQRMRIVEAVYRSAKHGKEVTLGKTQ
jgi:predicted dehydrogenase